MNLRGSERLRMLLMGAVAAGVIAPQHLVHAANPVPVPAKTKKPFGLFAAKPATTPPRLLPTAEAAVIQPVSQTEELAAATPGKKSEVMRQLELLYQQDGREMPELNTDIKPVPTGPGGAAAAHPTAANPSAPAAARPAAPAAPNGLRIQQSSVGQKGTAPSVAPSTSPSAPPETPAAKSKYPVLAFFKKLVPGSKDPKPTPAPAQYRPDVAPVPPGIAAQRPTQLQPEPNRLATADASAGSTLPLLDSQPRTPFAATSIAVSDPLPKPLAALVDVPPAPKADLPMPADQANLLPPLLADSTPAAPATLPDVPPASETPATETASPFTEMSEAEADKMVEMTPFTGLVLDDDAGSTKTPNQDVAVPGEPAEPAKADEPSPAGPAADDPFTDELKKMGVVPPGAEPTAPASKLTPPADSPTFEGIEDQATRDKMKKIHERGSMKGLKGFCPVTLRDQRELVDAKPDFHSTFRGQKFHFADADSKLKFDEDPTRFAPAAYGADVVALTRDKDVVEGSLDFAAWFKGRLYLFGSQEAHDTFVASPAMYATPVGIE